MNKPIKTAVGMIKIIDPQILDNDPKFKDFSLEQFLEETLKGITNISNDKLDELEQEAKDVSIKYKILPENNILFFFKPSSKLGLFPAQSQIETVSFNIVAMLFQLFTCGLFVKGAVAFGECTFDEKNANYNGQPLEEVKEWLNKQNWSGAVLCPSSENKFNPSDFPEDMFIRYNVPLKEEASKNILALHWVLFSDFPYMEILGEVKGRIKSKKTLSEADKSLIKEIDTTKDFIKYSQKNRDLGTFEELLAEFEGEDEDEDINFKE